MPARRDVDLLVTDGYLVDPHTQTEGTGDIAVSGGTIIEAGGTIDRSRAHRVIEANGMIVLPGVVDSHVHMPGRMTPDGKSQAHARLAVAGVTTAVEFAHFSAVVDEWHTSSAGLTLLGLEGMPAHTGHVASNQIAADVEAATQKGAIGVKILGGHFPSTPEATERIIEESTQRGLYTAFHAGTTRYGSNLDGMVEALELAAGRPLHLAHTNAYLRGAVRDLMDENMRALTLLQENPRVVTESHLAPLNVAFGAFQDDLPTDHIARNCLALEGYEISESGVRSAIGAGRAYVHTSHSPDPVTGQAAQEDWNPQAAPMLSFAVNRRLTAYLQATARLSSTGKLVFEGPGTFLVDAISSDGGGWRNLILDQGILLVQFGAMSWQQLAHKTSLRPAQLFGLYDKGKLIPGADADIIVVDADKRSVETTIAAGKIIAEKGRSISSGGVVFTTADGADHLRQRHIPFRIHDLSNSVFMTKGTS